MNRDLLFKSFVGQDRIDDSAELGVESGRTKLVLNTYGAESNDPGAAKTKMNVLDDALEVAFRLSSMEIEVTINGNPVRRIRDMAAGYRSLLNSLEEKGN